MDDEAKKAAEAAEFEKTLEGLPEEDKTKKREERQKAHSQNADVEADLKRERDLRTKAESELAETRRKAREAAEERRKKREAEGLLPDEGADKPLTKAEAEQFMIEREERIRKEMREERVRETAKKLTESDSEAELVVEIWKNRTLAGTIEEQIAEAHSIALGRKLRAQNAELQRAIASGGSVVTDALSGQRTPPPKGPTNVADTDKTVLQGMTWDAGKRRYWKKLQGTNKIFCVSEDLKKRWREDAPSQK